MTARMDDYTPAGIAQLREMVEAFDKVNKAGDLLTVLLLERDPKFALTTAWNGEVYRLLREAVPVKNRIAAILAELDGHADQA